MSGLKNQAEIDAYYLDGPAQPRAAGVLWPALIEHRIDNLFLTALRPDEPVHNELFRPSGALGNYSVKVRLAYMLGWIENDVFEDLLIVARIRNRFAHSIEANNFSDQKISAWVGNMKAYQSLPTLKEWGSKRADADPSTKNLAYVDIVTDMIEDKQFGFRYCIDILLTHLDRCHENMERNLAKLPGNWLVSNPEPTNNPDPMKQE